MKVITHSYGPGHMAIFINGLLFVEFDFDDTCADDFYIDFIEKLTSVADKLK